MQAECIYGNRRNSSRVSLLVMVPIERPDRIAVPQDERMFRGAVNEHLEDLVMDSRYTHDAEVLYVAGPLEARLTQVLRQMQGSGF
jgi:hypothetical protein